MSKENQETLEQKRKQMLAAEFGKEVDSRIWSFLRKHDLLEIDSFSEVHEFYSDLLNMFEDSDVPRPQEPGMLEDIPREGRGDEPGTLRQKRNKQETAPETRTNRERSGEPTVAVEERQRALAIAIARCAETEPESTWFREKHLGGRVLEPAEADEWILSKHKEEGEPTLWMSRPIQTKRASRSGRKKSPARRAIPRRWAKTTPELKQLCWISASDDGKQRKVPVVQDGLLDHLRRISLWLSLKYRWTEAQATTFVLTGRVPEISLVLGRVSVANQMPVCTRIKLEIDPAASPKAVMARYKKIRNKVIPGRFRAQESKHLRLALFFSDPDESGTWLERMRRWNEQHPGEQYEEVRLFARDCSTAYKRLIEPGWASALQGRYQRKMLLELMLDEEQAGVSWEERMSRWNREHPQHTYRDVEEFKTDCQEAGKGEGVMHFFRRLKVGDHEE